MVIERGISVTAPREGGAGECRPEEPTGDDTSGRMEEVEIEE